MLGIGVSSRVGADKEGGRWSILAVFSDKQAEFRCEGVGGIFDVFGGQSGVGSDQIQSDLSVVFFQFLHCVSGFADDVFVILEECEGLSGDSSIRGSRLPSFDNQFRFLQQFYVAQECGFARPWEFPFQFGVALRTAFSQQVDYSCDSFALTVLVLVRNDHLVMSIMP